MKKEFVIVGGGTAGWITALYLNKLIGEHANITLIESSDIGIIGVGEGSTPTLITMLKILGIDINQFIKKTNATHKLGIKFENWNGDDKNYFHSFGSLHKELDYLLNNYIIDSGFAYSHLNYLHNNNIDFENIDLATKLADKNLSPILKDKFNEIRESVNYSLHFDSHLISEFLKNTQNGKSIKKIVDDVIDFKVTDDGNIKSIITKRELEIKCDFVFDCTGFKRLIIGNLFKTKWKSYNQQLKVNRAITFQLEQSQTEIKPYTTATAMKYGWMWQIPLQNRIGCGYNFDSNFITDEECILEIQNKIGKEIKVGKVIDYNAGVFEKTWVNNCIAIGLSSGFTEPIEATSIFSAINQLWFINKIGILINDEKSRDEYNDEVSKMNDSILDFLYFHYFTKRTDTQFWKDYVKDSKLTKFMEEFIDESKNNPPNISKFIRHPFGLHSWLSVGFGLEFFDKKIFEENSEKYDLKLIEEKNNKIINKVNELVNNSYSEIKYLKTIL